MRTRLLYLLFLLIPGVLGAQVSYFFNDTIYPFPNQQTQLFHVFEYNTYYYLEGYVTQWGGYLPELKFFVKTDDAGNIIKKRSFDKSIITTGGEYYNTVIQVRDGLVNASYRRDSLYHTHCKLMHINYDLDTSWTKEFPLHYFDSNAVLSFFTDIKETWDYGYMIAGHISMTQGNSSKYPFLLRLDRYGNVMWKEVYKHPQFFNTEFRRIELTPDSGIVLLTNKNIGSVIRTDSNGTIQWITKIPNDSIYATYGDFGYIDSNNYIVACPYMYQFIPGSPNYGHIFEGISISSINYLTGQLNWEKRHIHFRSFHFYPNFQYFRLSSQEFCVFATAENIPNPLSSNDWSDMGVLLKYNSSGDSLAGAFFKTNQQKNCWLNFVHLESSGNIVGVGMASGLNNVFAAGWFFKTDTNTILNVPQQGSADNNSEIKIFPVPARDEVCFELQTPESIDMTLVLYSIQGKEMLSERLPAGKRTHHVSLQSLAPGMYLYSIAQKGARRYSGKLIIE